jgi:hypothetical protein
MRCRPRNPPLIGLTLYYPAIVTEYRINLAEIRSFADFVAAFNAGMIDSVGGHWNGNVDAFNDYLSWPEDEAYRLVLVGWERCAKVLDQTTASGDRPMLQVIREIFTANPHVTVCYA